jgi:hypothetical protein
MKRACFIVFVSMVAISCFSQPAQTIFSASFTSDDRMTMVKNSIDIPAWHEKSFWPVYENYISKAEDISLHAYRSLDDLVKMDASVSEEEAYGHARKFLDYRIAELAVMKQYYGEIAVAMNGIVSLQFLQAETLLDMMESARIYDGSVYRRYRFHPNVVDENEFTAAKYNTIAKAINLPADKAQTFYEVYTKYDSECDDLLGQEYSVFGYYAIEPSDFTPGLAKRLGHDLLNVMQREMKLKEKYFMEMNNTVGPVLAARFLAWEDYYSLVNKMHVWSEGFSEY